MLYTLRGSLQLGLFYILDLFKKIYYNKVQISQEKLKMEENAYGSL